MTTHNPVISVIIPNYNGAAYLPACLDSVLAQTYPDLEVIVVDDASRDSSPDILRGYAQQDPRVRPLLKKINGGVSSARNDGMDAASGEYFMFIDSDDWIDPQTCAVALESARAHQADVIMWSYIREMERESRPRTIYTEDRIYGPDDIRSQLYRKMLGPVREELSHPENCDALSTVWGKLYRAELIAAHRLRFIDLKLIGTYEDGMFNLEVFRYARKAVYLNQHFYHYRRNIDTSLSTQYRPRLWGQWQCLFDRMAEHLEHNALGPDFHDALSNRIAFSLIQLGINAMETPDGYSTAIRGIRQIMDDPRFRSALTRLELRYMPIHWKLFFTFARMNWAFGVYLLLWAIQKIRGR